MAEAVLMPKQGQSVETCIITEWYKKVGDSVTAGELLFAYETDKASFEEEAKADGILLEVFYNEGDEAPVLTNIAVIGQPGEDTSSIEGSGSANVEAEAPVAEVKEEVAPAAKAPAVSEVTTTTATPSGELFISPRAKNLASSNAVPVGELKGSGPNGRIIEADVAAYIESHPKMTPLAKKIVAEGELKASEKGSGIGGKVTSKDLVAPMANTTYGVDYQDKPLSNIRKLIANAMHQSLQNSAQLTHHLGADARNILALRKKAKAALEAGRISANITLNDMVCFAVIKALKKFPNVNSHFTGDAMRLFNKVHLGLAVDTERGLMVPSIRNADDLSIFGLSNQMKEVAGQCRKGSVNPELLASNAATFTVSNLGNYGVEMFTPVINLPQSAILGVNTIIPRPKDLGDGVYGFVPYLGLSLTYDHRALDGGEATRFVKQIAIEIETLSLDI